MMFYLNYLKLAAKTYAKVLSQNRNGRSQNDSDYYDIGIINPGIGTSNLGDLIIYDAVISELRKTFRDDLFTNYPSQLHTGFDAKRLMSEKDLLFVSGTNMLSSNMDSRHQWKIGPGHKPFLKNKVLLLGAGWWQYQDRPNRYTIDLYKTVFSDKHLHSVRDSYSYNMLKSIGIENVVNTSCPTLWNLNTDHCSTIPQTKAENVVTTLTFYKANPELDRKMMQILSENYSRVYLWVQGLDDVKYLKKIDANCKNIEFVAPTIDAFNKVLEDPSVEYLGTRLHAGVRALQKGKRTQIVAVDNRAVEIAKDTNLNVIKRENIEQMFDFIEKVYQTKITLPVENIKSWRQALPAAKLG